MRAAHRHISRTCVAGCSFLIGNSQFRCRAPQPCEVVVMPRLLAEHVHNEAAKIQQGPFGRGAPFAMLRRAPQLLIELLLDFRANRLHLRGTESRANPKGGSKRTY